MRLVISGYYGYGNTGDEAVLEGMLTSLHKAGHVHTTVLSADPEATRALHGVDAISRTDPRGSVARLGPGGSLDQRRRRVDPGSDECPFVPLLSGGY